MSKFLSVFALSVFLAAAQDSPDTRGNTANMQMSGMNAAGEQLMNLSSGTSMQPESWSMPMKMVSADGWNLMFMGQAFLVETDQVSPRGGDKFYSSSAGMFRAGHDFGRGSLLFDMMLSLDPPTITERRYPELFQTGETAFNKPLVDAQHPHNFIMALGVHYARSIAEDTVLQFYVAPVGDPALGPVAFPHRASASAIPQAPPGHHWQDSTHIAYDVVTAGVLYKKFRLEASGFYGTEPGENRWIIDSGPINSWSTRLWFLPGRNWAAQISVGRLARSERQIPGDVVRSTASVEYNRPIGDSGWATSLIWGRNHEILAHRNLNSYLLESVLPFARKNFLTGRAELVDKDELFADQPSREATVDRTVGSTFRIGAYTLGYTRDIGVFKSTETGIGVNFTAYTTPDAIKPYYGEHPTGWNVFLRLRYKP